MLQGATNVQLAQCHHSGFKYYLHYDHHGLLHHSNPLAAAQLFGGTVKEKIGDLEKIKQEVQKVCCKRGQKPPQYRRNHSDFLGKWGGVRGHRRRRKRSGYSNSSESDNHNHHSGKKTRGTPAK